jgi:IrrE N-terminal-like domain
MLRNADRCARFDPFALAPQVGLTVVKDCDFEGLEEADRQEMERAGERSWSGGVYPTPLPDGSKLCILNPYQSERRRRITLMEEICHCYLAHRPTSLVVNSGGLLVRDFDKRQEEEAYGVGAAVLLPWVFLFPKLNQGTSVEELSEMFDVTKQLVEYRIKICGATSLFRARSNLRGGSAQRGRTR